MRKQSFKLTTPEVQPIHPGPVPDEVCIPLRGHMAQVKRKDEIYAGTRIAIHPDQRRGDAHSPIDGIVTSITPDAICIKRQEVNNPAVEKTKPLDLSTLHGQELSAAIKSLGLGTREFGSTGDHIVLNGFNPEPGIIWAASMFRDYLEELKAAVEMIRRLMNPSQISIVLPQGSQVNFGNSIRHFYSKPVYPNSIKELVIKTATQKENPKNVSCLSMHSLWRYGQVATTGLPALSTVMTVQDKNYIVLAGTSFRSLLSFVDIYPEDGDYVIQGGYMRGTATSNIDSAVASYSFGLYYVGKDEFSTVHENPCINCGACVQYCPAHLMPNIISRNAEFKNYEACRQLYVNSCMDCGLCSYYCIARRPMMQYMREAKKQIAFADQVAAAKASI